jgi:hypothetical protein
MKSIILDSKTNLELSGINRQKHIFISGLPGNGVATYVCNLISQDVESKQTTIVLDYYGDLYKKVKNTTSYTDNLGYIKLGENNFSLNIFENVETETEKILLVKTILGQLRKLFDPQSLGIIGPRFEQATRSAILAVLYDKEPSFLKVVKCFTDSSYLNQLLLKIKDPMLKNYFGKVKEGPIRNNDIGVFITSKLLPLVSDSRIQLLLKSSDYSRILEEVIKNKQAIILDMSIFKHEEDMEEFIYSLLLFKLEQILQKDKSDNKISVYVDEVQSAGEELASLYRFSGKYGLAITAISTRALLIPEYLQYEITRSGTVVSFRQSVYDNHFVEELFENEGIKNEIKLLNLPQFSVYIKTLNNKGGTKIERLDLSK